MKIWEKKLIVTCLSFVGHLKRWFCPYDIFFIFLFFFRRALSCSGSLSVRERRAAATSFVFFPRNIYKKHEKRYFSARFSGRKWQNVWLKTVSMPSECGKW